MKIKEYLNSLVTRRKSTSGSKSIKPKSHHASISSTDGQYEICGYEDPNKYLPSDHLSRTQVLLNRHAQLVNTIVEIRSQQESRVPQQSTQENLVLNRNYSSTLATSNPRRERQQAATFSNNSLSNKVRQRSKIRTNPWIKTTPTSQVEHKPIPPSSGLVHSESFPQTISNVVLHQSDSGQGFSISSSRVIDSSSPDNTSSDGPILDEKRRREQHYFSKTNPSDNKRRGKQSSIQSRQQRPSSIRTVTNPRKQNYHAHSSSPRSRHDHFSTEFEDIVENERLNKSRKSPFILPLEETNVPSMKKTNSHTILKHIEEIENEIRMIKNLNLDPDEQIFSSNNSGERQSIHEQVDQWIEECLTTNQPTTLIHKPTPTPNYVLCVYSDKNQQPSSSSLPKPPKKPEIMTAFYLSSIPTKSTTHFQPIATHECPF